MRLAFDSGTLWTNTVSIFAGVRHKVQFKWTQTNSSCLILAMTEMQTIACCVNAFLGGFSSCTIPYEESAEAISSLGWHVQARSNNRTVTLNGFLNNSAQSSESRYQVHLVTLQL